MNAIELKFLFEGIIFSTPVSFFREANRLQFNITLVTKYLLNRYASQYTLEMEGYSFKKTHCNSIKEQQLLESIQEAILHHPLLAQQIMPYGSVLQQAV